jgi:DNA-directed RNA polymerase specialized sigma24 family protein
VAELLGAHATQAHRLALHIVRNQVDAEDATQTAFVNAFTNLGRFDERRPFAPWLLRIVAREALKVLRADRTRWDSPRWAGVPNLIFHPPRDRPYFIALPAGAMAPLVESKSRAAAPASPPSCQTGSAMSSAVTSSRRANQKILCPPCAL